MPDRGLTRVQPRRRGWGPQKSSKAVAFGVEPAEFGDPLGQRGLQPGAVADDADMVGVSGAAVL